MEGYQFLMKCHINKQQCLHVSHKRQEKAQDDYYFGESNQQKKLISSLIWNRECEQNGHPSVEINNQ
jgi:hypothetical protein